MKKISKRLISSLLAIAMLASTLAFSVIAYAEDFVSINNTNFTDDNFRTIISRAYDENNDGFLNTEERNLSVMTLAAYVEEICGEDATIENLKGIEFFPNLRKLYCAGIGLTSLDVSSNTKLVLLSASGNNLTDITLGTQNNLENLDVSANDLTSLSLATCPNITNLQCYSNALTRIDVSVLPRLEIFYCQQNSLATLNLKSNQALTKLHCAHNCLWELDLSANTNLQELTSAEIGNQWVKTGSYKQGVMVYANHVFSKSAGLVASSLDITQETEEGTVTTLAYANGNFYTRDARLLKDRLVDEKGKLYDGIIYTYNVGNANCENMTVNVVVNRTFYQVNYYLDETKQELISYEIVNAGSSSYAPAVPDAPECKRFVAWSDEATNVMQDMDIYIIWADDHVMHWLIDRSYNVSMYCENCIERTVSFNFRDAYNSRKGQPNYVEKGDMNKDGVINAKDYAIIIHL